MKNQLYLLKSKRFLPLFITQFFGAFNDNAFKNALLIWFTYDIANANGMNASMMVSLAAGLFILPFFLFSATAGQAADKYEKSWLSQKIKLVEILLMIACAIFFFLGNIYGLLIVLFFMGIQSTFFGPIKYSLLPEHLKDDELIAGNGLIEGGTFLSILLGTLFGGLIIRMEYGVALLSFFIISFAIIGWLSSRSIPKTPINDATIKIDWNIITQTWKIIGYARQKRTVWLSIISISWFWLIGALFLTQLPTYTKQIIHGNEDVVTLFLTLFSVGIGLGSILCNKLLNGEINGRWVPYGCIGMSAAIIIFVSASHFYNADISELKTTTLGILSFLSMGYASWGIILGLLSLAVCAGIYIVPLYAIMQHRSEGHYLSRIIAANNVMNALFMVLSSVAAIILFSFGFSVTQILLTAGLLNILVFFITRHTVKKRLHHA